MSRSKYRFHVLFTTQAAQIATLAAHYSIPAAYSNRAYAEVGGLMSYGPDYTETCRQVGIYTGQILKGGKPADMPVQQVTKIELVINLKTAKTLGLDVPLGLSAAAGLELLVGTGCRKVPACRFPGRRKAVRDIVAGQLGTQEATRQACDIAGTAGGRPR
jgi:hypothetical protein